MPASVPIVSSLTVLVLVSSTYGTIIGDLCTVNNSPGVCKLLNNCPRVYQELLAGKSPKQTCGYVGYDPVVCCPTTDGPTPRPTLSSTSPPRRYTTERLNEVRPLSVDGTRGSLARAICAENAKAVYGLVRPPTPIADVQPVNTSLCALTTRKLIVGGTKAEAKEFPHMAAVGFNSPNGILWNCGGTLISSKIVMTAAHCTWTQDWGNAAWIRLGDLNLKQTNDNAMPQTIAIKERIRHPEYKRPSEYHDIAILRLEKEAVYNAFVRPACLPVDLPDVGQDNKAVATGWGLVDWYDDEGSENLLKVTLRLVPHAICNASYFDGISAELARGIVNKWQICAGEPGKDTCQGDSGGPLTIFNTNHECMYNVIGITSIGRFCGDTDNPGVYTRVYNYIPWIETTAWSEYIS